MPIRDLAGLIIEGERKAQVSCTNERCNMPPKAYAWNGKTHGHGDPTIDDD